MDPATIFHILITFYQDEGPTFYMQSLGEYFLSVRNIWDPNTNLLKPSFWKLGGDINIYKVYDPVEKLEIKQGVGSYGWQMTIGKDRMGNPVTFYPCRAIAVEIRGERKFAAMEYAAESNRKLHHFLVPEVPGVSSNSNKLSTKISEGWCCVFPCVISLSSMVVLYAPCVQAVGVFCYL